MRACQSMFASTAFCILSALLYIVTAVILIIFSIQKALREKQAAQVKVGGHYQLGPSPSEYRRAEQAHEVPTESVELKEEVVDTSPSTDPATITAANASTAATPDTAVLSPMTSPVTTTNATQGNIFSTQMYQDPANTAGHSASHPLPTTTVLSPPAGIVAGTPSPFNTYSGGGGGHVPQVSQGGYDYNTTPSGHMYGPSNHSDYYGHGATTGHIQQGSGVSNMSANAYNPYASSGNTYLPQGPHQ
ncbi:hypothetical protein BGZ65_000057, partial [Modicella reniformis]